MTSDNLKMFYAALNLFSIEGWSTISVIWFHIKT